MITSINAIDSGRVLPLFYNTHIYFKTYISSKYLIYIYIYIYIYNADEQPVGREKKTFIIIIISYI